MVETWEHLAVKILFIFKPCHRKYCLGFPAISLGNTILEWSWANHLVVNCLAVQAHEFREWGASSTHRSWAALGNEFYFKNMSHVWKIRWLQNAALKDFLGLVSICSPLNSYFVRRQKCARQPNIKGFLWRAGIGDLSWQQVAALTPFQQIATEGLRRKYR